MIPERIRSAETVQFPNGDVMSYTRDSDADPDKKYRTYEFKLGKAHAEITIPEAGVGSTDASGFVVGADGREYVLDGNGETGYAWITVDLYEDRLGHLHSDDDGLGDESSELDRTEGDRGMVEKDRRMMKKDRQMVEKDRRMLEKDRRMAEEDRMAREELYAMGESDKTTVVNVSVMVYYDLDFEQEISNVEEYIVEVGHEPDEGMKVDLSKESYK